MSESRLSLDVAFSKATTLVDGGWRISFDVDQSQTAKVATVALLKKSLLKLTIESVEDDYYGTTSD